MSDSTKKIAIVVIIGAVFSCMFCGGGAAFYFLWQAKSDDGGETNVARVEPARDRQFRERAEKLEADIAKSMIRTLARNVADQPRDPTEAAEKFTRLIRIGEFGEVQKRGLIYDPRSEMMRYRVDDAERRTRLKNVRQDLLAVNFDKTPLIRTGRTRDDVVTYKKVFRQIEGPKKRLKGKWWRVHLVPLTMLSGDIRHRKYWVLLDFGIQDNHPFE